MPKVSPNLPIASAMAEAKYVDAGPAIERGRLLPNDAGPIANTIRYLKLPTQGELRPQTERDALETRLEPIESRNS
jgi:hypothetical protein